MRESRLGSVLFKLFECRLLRGGRGGGCFFTACSGVGSGDPARSINFTPSGCGRSRFDDIRLVVFEALDDAMLEVVLLTVLVAVVRASGEEI